MSVAATPPPKHPPPWFVHTAWRVHRALDRLSGGRFLWTTSNKRGWARYASPPSGESPGKSAASSSATSKTVLTLSRIAMNGWDEDHPAWWRNLEAHPDAVIRLPHQQPRLVRGRPSAGRSVSGCGSAGSRSIRGSTCMRSDDRPRRR